VVRPPGRPPSTDDRKRLEELRRLTSMLGARLRVEEGEDVAAVAISVARAIGSTYVLIGTPSPRRGLARFGLGGSDRTLLGDLLRGLPGVDVRIVADPSLRRQPGGEENRPAAAGAEGARDEGIGLEGSPPGGEASGAPRKSY
jgi:K+-sensing histidine kinase KdpD